jgi:hypothetical protein
MKISLAIVKFNAFRKMKLRILIYSTMHHKIELKAFLTQNQTYSIDVHDWRTHLGLNCRIFFSLALGLSHMILIKNF